MCEFQKEVHMENENKSGYYFEVYCHEKKWFWRLKTAQHKIVGKCEQPYKSKGACKTAVERLVAVAPSAEIRVHD